MSQVNDWSDGYTSDYLRNLNAYGPASANVPRSSVVSHQVRYRAPDTSDIPLAPGQNPEDSVYSNASGARMGQTKPASGYRAPAGRGYTAETFPSSGGSGRRYARPKKPVKRQAQPVKKQAQNYGSYRDLSDPLSQHILANGSPEPKPPVESVVSRAQDITDQSDMYRAIAGLSSPPSANDSQSEVRTAGGINPAGAGSASVPETNFNRGLMGGVGRQVESMRAPDSEQPAQSVLAGPDESVKFANLPPEVLRDIAERKGRSFAGNLFNDIPWWAMVGPAGSPAGAIGSRLYGPVAERLLAPKGPLTGGARTTLTSADEGLPVGYSMLRNPKIDASPLASQTSSLVQQLRAAGIPEDQIAASIARINAGAAGREAAAAGEQAAGREAAAAGEAAADGGVSELANAGNAGRETAAGAATGSVSEGVDSASQQLIEHIRSGTLDEMERAWIEAIADAVSVPGTIDASTQAILNEARFAGLIP